MRSLPLISVSDAPSKRISQKDPLLGYPRWIYVLFFLFAFYLAIPVIDIPLLGLSLSAPIFFLIAIPCILRPPKSWFHTYRYWIIVAVLIWLGIFTSSLGNGLLSGGVDINGDGMLNIIRFAYWLLVFVVTVYFASQEDVVRRIAKLLGWAILFLALLRWGEVFIYRNIGAWTGTHLLLENDYGFLFSTFSPFLLILLLEQKGVKLLLTLAGNILLWGAAAINGSRGSWVSIAIGLMIALFLLVRTSPKKFIGLLAGILFAGVLSGILLVGIPEFSNAVISRVNTFQSLSTDKSYAIRQLMDQKAILLFEGSPLIGVGTARFTQTSVPLKIPAVLRYAAQAHFDVKSAHNSYLGFLAENGLIAVMPFGVLLAILFTQGLRAQSHFASRKEYWALAIFLSFVQMSIHMWVISSLTNTANWFVYGLMGATIMVDYMQRRS